jgi:hypothetical protein
MAGLACLGSELCPCYDSSSWCLFCLALQQLRSCAGACLYVEVLLGCLCHNAHTMCGEVDVYSNVSAAA